MQCKRCAGSPAHAWLRSTLCAVPRAVCGRCRCSELEGKRLQDSERLTAVNTELSKLKELYWSKKGEAVRGNSRLQDV